MFINLAMLSMAGYSGLLWLRFGYSVGASYALQVLYIRHLFTGQ